MVTDEPPDQDVLAIPDTKPQMFLFLPYEFAIFMAMAFFVIDIQTHSLINGFLIGPIWFGFAVLVRRDVNGIRVMMVNLRYGLMYLGFHRWGGLSVSPWQKEK